MCDAESESRLEKETIMATKSQPVKEARLGRDELLLAAKVLGEAQTWIYRHANDEEQ